MKYVAFSLVLAITFLILITSVYAEDLRTDILRKFFTITGMAGELETTTETTTQTTETEPTTTETVAPPAEIAPAPACPDIGISCLCPDGSGCPKFSDEKGCTYWGPCPEVKPAEGEVIAPIENPIIIKEACPPMTMQIPQCPEDQQPIPKYDEKGCPSGYECLPMAKPPVEGGIPISCPERQTCPDGSTLPCRIENNNCICEPCPIKEGNIPPGCWQEVEKETGFVKIVCEKIERCPDETRQAEMKRKCVEEGGTPVPFQDPSGCTFYDCKFGERQREESKPNPITGYEKCPLPEEIDLSIKKCNEAEMFGAVSFEGGCRVVKCVRQKEERCKILTAEMRLRIEQECEKKGLKTIKNFDKEGCVFFECTGGEFCKRELPKEAFDECREKGGEMVIKRDEKGCVVYTNCVERGDEREIYVEPMEKVPEPTELLAVALKLEQLKIELDKLARQADDIANYYASTGNSEEHRFRRASNMFDSIKDKIDSIKNELKSKLDTLTSEDMEKIRFDIKSVKESLKDIVYVMLSNSDEVKEMIQVEAERKGPTKPVTPERIPEMEIAEGANCGTDGYCFDKAIRVCKPITFLPEGRAGPTVTVKGLEGDACILHIELPEGQGPPEFKGKIYMDCQIKDYSFGIRGPEEILPYCKGPMKDMVEKYGTRPPERAPGGPGFGGPGGCTSDTECRAYCERNPDECLRWCRDNPGMCPEEAEFGLERAAEGRTFEFVMCTPEAERLWQDCLKRGGKPQSDPSPEGRCEVYTTCLMSGASGRCDCTWPAGSVEHPTGCSVLCSDFSFDSGACESQRASGCAWVSGTREEVPVEERAVQPCVGCLNNGICDVGECSECIDCLRR